MVSPILEQNSNFFHFRVNTQYSTLNQGSIFKLQECTQSISRVKLPLEMSFLDKKFPGPKSSKKSLTRDLQGMTNSDFLAQKLGKSVEKTNIIVARLIGYKFFELWNHKVAKFFDC
jgi:protein-arginine kinase